MGHQRGPPTHLSARQVGQCVSAACVLRGVAVRANCLSAQLHALALQARSKGQPFWSSPQNGGKHSRVAAHTYQGSWRAAPPRSCANICLKTLHCAWKRFGHAALVSLSMSQCRVLAPVPTAVTAQGSRSRSRPCAAGRGPNAG